MLRIVFVCHGNICRSPMAEFILRDMLKKRKISDKIEVISRATSAEELGNPVYPPARSELARHGLSCVGKCSVLLRAEDYKNYDLFIGMDSANIRNMNRLFGGDPEGKIKKFMSYTGSDSDVADPWFTGDFDTTYRDVYRGCEKLCEEIEKSV